MQRIVALALISALGLSACGGGGGSDSTTRAAPNPPPPAPTLNLSVSPTSIDSGASSMLSWTTANADTCSASGGWTGAQSTSGSADTGALSQSTQFTLSCDGPGGPGSSSVIVAINGSPAPIVTLSASPPGVALGSATTLTWSSTNATSCTASRDWTGGKGTGGSESTGKLNQDATYQIDCTAPGGSGMAMTTVTVRAASLTWEPPTNNVDGTPLTSLSGFTVYWGTSSRNYTNSATINDPATLSYFVELTPATYFFAVTARDSDGGVSAYSGEVSKTIF